VKEIPKNRLGWRINKNIILVTKKLLCVTKQVDLTGVHSVNDHLDSKHFPSQGIVLAGFGKWEHIVSDIWEGVRLSCSWTHATLWVRVPGPHWAEHSDWLTVFHLHKDNNYYLGITIQKLQIHITNFITPRK